MVVVLLSFTACESKKECSVSNCAGCCDASGECQPGTLATACGLSGAACTACGPQTCNLGFCGNGSGNTGGGSGSTGGGSGTTGGGSGTVTTYADFCAAAMSAYYGYNVRCGTYSADYAQSILAQTNCTVPDGFTAGRMQFNATGAQACIDQFNATACNQYPPSGCTGAFTGLVAMGGNCFTTSECAGNAWCDLRSTCPGTCAARVADGQPSSTMYGEDCALSSYRYGDTCTPRVAVGSSCAPTGSVTDTQLCVQGAYCSAAETCVVETRLAANAACTVNTSPECSEGTSCLNGVCTPYRAVNETCDSARPCKFGLQCGAANVCVAYGAVGASCGATAQCAPTNFCDYSAGEPTGTCVARRAVNGTCTGSGQCQSGLWCNGDSQTPGTCAAPVALSGACNSAHAYEMCSPSLYCTTISNGMSTGVCAARKSVGAACSSGECVDSATCNNGTCTRLYCAP